MLTTKNTAKYCPVLSVKISRCGYEYTPFKRAELTCSEAPFKLSDSLFKDGKKGFENIAALRGEILGYCAGLVENVLCRGEDFFKNADRLADVYSFICGKGLVLERLVRQWLCDLCLATENFAAIPCFADRGIPLMFSGEFCAGSYITDILKRENGVELEKTEAFLKCISSYDIFSSAFYRKNTGLYGKIISAVISGLFDYIYSRQGREFFIPESKTVNIKAFTGLICNKECARSLEVEYIPFSENSELCTLISDAVRYTENLIRQGLGEKSKIVGFTLAPEYRRLISDIIRETVPDFLPAPAKVGRKPVKKARMPDQKSIEQEMPEPIDLNIDISRARRLEAESWRLTDMLYADYGGNDISFDAEKAYKKEEEQVRENQEPEAKGQKSSGNPENIPEDWQNFYLLLTGEEKTILSLICTGTGAEEYAKKCGGLLYGFIQSINEKASDAYGDIILCENGTEFDFIEDYRKELSEIFSGISDTEVQ